MANTTNLDLVKPLGTDHALISQINGNMDKIDAYAGNTNSSLNSLADGIAIISVGDTHAAITSGQFVYVRGHGTLADGLYVATSNISANATLSGSNLTADTAGGLNTVYSSLNSNMSIQSVAGSTSIATLVSQTPSNSIRRYYIGNSSNLSDYPSEMSAFTNVVMVTVYKGNSSAGYVHIFADKPNGTAGEAFAYTTGSSFFWNGDLNSKVSSMGSLVSIKSNMVDGAYTVNHDFTQYRYVCFLYNSSAYYRQCIMYPVSILTGSGKCGYDNLLDSPNRCYCLKTSGASISSVSLSVSIPSSGAWSGGYYELIGIK